MAGGASFQSDDDSAGMIADINVTPLVDITLVLLIIFMVTAPMIVNNPSIKVELPKAATGDETTKTPLAITLTKEPAGGYAIYANGEKIEEAKLRGDIPAMLKENKDLQVIIAADKGLAYGDIVHIVDLVKALGVHKFALNTDATP